MILHRSDPRLEICLKKSILQDLRLSIEGIGFYAMLEAGLIAWGEIPHHVAEELKEVGYEREVTE